MFDPSPNLSRNPAIAPAVGRALKLLKGRQRGDVVLWEALEAVAGFGRADGPWTHFNRVLRRRFLKDTGILVWPVAGEGLQLVSCEDQLHRCQFARQRRARRQLTRAIVELKALPNSELSAHDRIVKHRKLEQARTARKAIKYSLQVVTVLNRPSCAR